MDAGEAGAGTAAAVTSPTRSAQEVLRRMSLNSPPSRTDNPRHIKRAKVSGGMRVCVRSSCLGSLNTRGLRASWFTLDHEYCRLITIWPNLNEERLFT